MMTPHYADIQLIQPHVHDTEHEHSIPMQRQWQPRPAVDAGMPRPARLTAQQRSVAMSPRQRASDHHVTHTAQAYTLSLAAQMMAQESPISEQGPPASIADSPWINDAPGTYWTTQVTATAVTCYFSVIMIVMPG